MTPDLTGRNTSSIKPRERESYMAGIGKKIEGAAKKAVSDKATGKGKGKGTGGGSGASKAKDAINKLTK